MWTRRAGRLCALLAGAALIGACAGHRGPDPTATAAGPAPTAGSTTSRPAQVMFGDLPSPCGPGPGGPATEQGVTADSIVIGYGDDAGFSLSPGLNHQTSDAMKAFVSWCNDQGGINGRRLDARYYDAKITEVTNVMLQACSTVFMLVGEAWAFDSAQEETRLGCKLPAVPTYSVGAEFAHGPLSVQPVPNPIDFQSITDAEILAKAFPAKVKKTAVIFGNFTATRDTTAKVQSTYPHFGWEFLPCPQEYNIVGEPDWKPFAQRVKECGAEVVYFSGEPFPNFVNFLAAADQLDFHPIYLVEANFYTPAFAAFNKEGLADDVYVKTSFVPLEEAKANPATRQYLDIVRASGGDASQLGEQTTSAFLLWATAAKACGAQLTRQCVLDQLATVHHWTGGGLHAATDPAGNKPGGCGAVLRLQGTRWVRWKPAKTATFDCAANHVQPVTGAVVDRAKLDANRKSTRFSG